MEGGLVKTRPLKRLKAARAFGVMLGGLVASAATAAAITGARRLRCTRLSSRLGICVGAAGPLSMSARYRLWTRSTSLGLEPELAPAFPNDKPRLAPPRMRLELDGRAAWPTYAGHRATQAFASCSPSRS
jgi:hypothetical protein